MSPNAFRPTFKVDTGKSSFHPTFKNIGDFVQRINLSIQPIPDAEIMEEEERKCMRREAIAACSEIMEEEERKCMRREAIAACMQCILDHLSGFLKELPNCTYEQWILKLHPDNANDKHHSNIANIDHRFYVEESDHRLIWNENMDTLATGNIPNRISFLSRKVQSRFKHGAP